MTARGRNRSINQRNLSRVRRRITDAADVEHRGINHLRDTYGTTLGGAGVHERTAQQLLGHADSRTTREIYTHVSERMLDQAAKAISTPWTRLRRRPWVRDWVQ